MSTLKTNEITNNGSAVNFSASLLIGNDSVEREYYEQATEPTSAGSGAIWWNTDTLELRVYLSEKWYTVTTL
jgi:hypothetical protein